MTENEAMQLAKEIIAIPENYRLAEYEKVSHDKLPIVRMRFISDKNSENQMGGEHFSITVDPHNRRLMGLMHLEKTTETENYVDEEQAKSITFDFLRAYAEDLIDTIEVRWIKPTRKIPVNSPHDDAFTLNDGSVITGMRVKLWSNGAGNYAWVIVNASGKVINFERDIAWSTLRHCRTTEKWLHDDWLQNNKKK